MSQLLEDKEEYPEKEWDELMMKAIQSHATAYRKQFKIAADACGIKYPVSTHSTRKTFGYWSVKLHPYDVTTVDKLQGIFSHSDRNTTLHYIGIAGESVYVSGTSLVFLAQQYDIFHSSLSNTISLEISGHIFRGCN